MWVSPSHSSLAWLLDLNCCRFHSWQKGEREPTAPVANFTIYLPVRPLQRGGPRGMIPRSCVLQASGQEVPRSLRRAKLALGLSSLGPAELVFSTCRLSLAFHLNLLGSLELGQLIQSHTWVAYQNSSPRTFMLPKSFIMSIMTYHPPGLSINIMEIYSPAWFIKMKMGHFLWFSEYFRSSVTSWIQISFLRRR